MNRPFDWAIDTPRPFPPIVGYGRGRPLFGAAIERQIAAEDALRHRREVTEVGYTPAEHFPVASLACGHMVRLADKGQMTSALGKRLPCPECAA